MPNEPATDAYIEKTRCNFEKYYAEWATVAAVAKQEGELLFARMIERLFDCYQDYFASDSLEDSEKNRLKSELDGLMSWLFEPNGLSRAESATMVSDLMRDAGYSVPHRVAIMESVPTKGAGRPPEICRQVIILALQMHELQGKTWNDIADALPHDPCGSGGRPHIDRYPNSNPCAERFRKSTKPLRKFLADTDWPDFQRK